jgi:hypothetical protein
MFPYINILSMIINWIQDPGFITHELIQDLKTFYAEKRIFVDARVIINGNYYLEMWVAGVESPVYSEKDPFKEEIFFF